MKAENKKIFILDCSVTMSWCFDDESTTNSVSILKSLKNHEALVPHLWKYEVANVLTLAIKKSRISQIDAVNFLTLLDKLPIIIDQTNVLPLDLIYVAQKYNLTAYDAAYLQLSMIYNAPVATFDSHLAQAVKLTGGQVL